MRRIIPIVLLSFVLLAFCACRQEDTAPSQGQPSSPQTESLDPDRPEEPAEVLEPEDDVLPPGRPVYSEVEAAQTANGQVSADPDGPPVEVAPGTHLVFDHFEDPPPEGSVRLVYLYDYGKADALLVEDTAQVDRILQIVDAFTPSDYSGGPLLGGSAVQIQAVRGGVHQCYSVLSGTHNGGYISTNEREAESWYETDAQDYLYLMDYFGELPQ